MADRPTLAPGAIAAHSRAFDAVLKGPKPKPTHEPCQSCRGTGTTQIPRGVFGMLFATPCPACKGSGRGERLRLLRGGRVG